MTNSNQPPRRPARRQPTRRSTTPRTSVPSARDELERERELYSQHDPTASFMHERVQNKPAGQERGASSAFPAYAGAGNDHIAHSRVATNQPAQTNQGHTANGNMSNVSAWDQHASATASQRMPRIEGQRPNMQGGQRMPRVAMPQDANQHVGAGDPSASQRMPRVEGQHPSAAQRQQRPVRRGAAASQPSQSMRVQAAQPQQNQPSQQIPVVQNMRGNDPSAYSRAKYQRTKEGAQKASPTNASTYQAARYLGNNNYAPKQKADFFTRGSLIAVAVVVVLAIVGVFAFNNWMGSKPVEVTLNGDQVTISGAERSVGGLLDNNVVSVTPGNYVAVDGSTIRQGEGTRCTAKVNGNDTDDMGMHLNGGDKIEISNGTDITEPYTDSEPQTLPHKTELKGVGAVHLYSNNAQDGEQVTRTGKESGITATVTTKEPINNIVQYYNVNSNGDKVIALTFDDGPWDKQTDEILDILEQNDAKATFFTVGQCISGHEKELQRAASMGCEIGTHTWDHAEGSGEGVSLIKMSTDERKQEVQKGLEAIKNATGQEASTIFRCPGGNFDTSVATDLEGIVTAEIGWNVDTTDWKKPGADVIAQRIQSAGPGNIILMHDGGGDRSQLAGFLFGHALLLAQFEEEACEFIDLIGSCGIDDFGTFEVVAFCVDLFCVAKDYQIRNALFQGFFCSG